jgi:hypothetical protein
VELVPVIQNVSLFISQGVPSAAFATVKVNYTIKSDPIYNDEGVWWESVDLYGASATGLYVVIPDSQILGPHQIFHGSHLQFTRILEKTFPLTLFLQNPSLKLQGVRPLYYPTVKAIARVTPFAIQSVSLASNGVPFVVQPMPTLKL